MEVVGLEEHIVLPEVLAAWHALDPRWQDLALVPSTHGVAARRLADLGDERRAAMAGSGVDVQVLSLTTPGVQNLARADAVALQTLTNDVIAAAVREDPQHYQGFATLATPDPVAAAAELERAVTTLGLDGAMLFGRTRDRNLDAPEFWPIYEVAEATRAPLYLHPQSPPPAVREAYYGSGNPALGAAFATHGIGWHYETGVQLLRLVLAGVFDRFPDLQVIVGHWGELVAFYLDRIDSISAAARLQRPVSEYFRSNVYLAPSGVFSHRYLRWAVEIVGVDRIVLSTDYPFVPTSDGAVRAFLDTSPLDGEGRVAFASGNWERLRDSIRRQGNP